jgi:diguanylate cyclase
VRGGLAVAVAGAERRLFDRIGDFLDAQRLAPDPVNYGFAHKVICDGDGALAQAVAALTEGGVRLTRQDIESLGGEVVAARPRLVAPEQAAAPMPTLKTRAREQVADFASMVETMHQETRGFGRDLAASAGALREAGRGDDVVRLTAAMIERVRAAESRLDAANREASNLRQELEGARSDARTDPLTELPNRRALEEAFAAMDGPACLAICDIDRFKTVNDRFGHAVGDRVLRAVGLLIAGACEGATVARYGGEEFAVLFPAIPPVAAERQIDQARQLVAAKRYRLRDTNDPIGDVTFSAGLVTVAPGEPFEEAFARADQLLYQAKNDGRNCVRAKLR